MEGASTEEVAEKEACVLVCFRSCDEWDGRERCGDVWRGYWVGLLGVCIAVSVPALVRVGWFWLVCLLSVSCPVIGRPVDDRTCT